ELLPIAELHRTLEPHTAELARRPRDGEERLLEASARHGLRAEAVPLAEHDREERHGEVRTDDEQAAHVPHEGDFPRLRSHRPPGRVAEEEERKVEGVT